MRAKVQSMLQVHAEEALIDRSRNFSLPIHQLPPPLPTQTLYFPLGSLCLAWPLLPFHHLSNVIFTRTTPAS